jgi:HD-GYP domain-containing protein (c-di-GMP phosphodiesterase class II)
MVRWLSRHATMDQRFPERVAKLVSFAVQCRPVLGEAMRGHCEGAELFARRLGFSDHVQRALRLQLERWDGAGLAYGLKGDDIPIAARVLHVARVTELAHHFGGIDAARSIAGERRGGRLDPQVADAFVAVSERDDFWPRLELESAREAILALAPPTEAELVVSEQRERVCEAVADLADMKTQARQDHSRLVADVAEGIGGRLGLDDAARTRLREAALVHDLGKVAMPYGILEKEAQDRLNGRDEEQFRLHPYYTQQILENVEPLQQLAETAASHHERVDGNGYHRRLGGERLPLEARILAVADAYAVLAHFAGEEEQSADVERALERLRSLVGTQLDGDCYTALTATVAGIDGPAKPSPRHTEPSGLTAREVEVLRLLARGLNTPQIAETLVLSRKTVGHHLENIYGKLGVTCRASAVVYAVQNRLV